MSDPTFHVVELSFSVVDVFAVRRYAGNQLAVFTDANLISASEMQAIANEIHFSETTFVTSREPRLGGYDVRIFTPNEEVPFAGHPVLGTAFIIQQELIGEPVERVMLNLKVGQVPVDITYRRDIPDLLWMQPKPAEFGRVLDPGMVAGGLNLRSGDIHGGFPIQEVTTGLPTLIVPLRTLEALRRVRISRTVMDEMMHDIDARCILCFTTETYSKENDVNVRVFADRLGIPEDPATGSGNGCLAAYLSRYKVLGKEDIDIRIEQGFEIGRPSLILLKAWTKEGGAIDVRVGGKVQLVARGQLV